MWENVKLIAHRCGGLLAPENSLAGLRAAAAAGFRAVEFDVMLSGDGTPWLIHDETLERTSDQRGEVAATGDAVLSRVRVGKERSRGVALSEPLPRLDQALALCAELGLLANIEIKPAPGYEVRTGEVAAAVVAEWLAGSASLPPPLFSSFALPALQAAARCAPHVPRAWLVERVPADWPSTLRSVGAAALHCAAEQPDAKPFSDLLASGLPVRCYTVNDPASAVALYARGVRAVFTDALPAMAAAGLATGC
jgi:glycerophosphoryl diester phosphodiesterase